MIVTVGNRRFSLYHVAGVNETDQNVSLINGDKIPMDAAHFAAFLKFWDEHAEIIKPEGPGNTNLPQPTQKVEREFPLGHEDVTTEPPGD